MSAPAWLRLLLRLYPRGFREEYGDAVVETYALRAARQRERGGGMLRFHAREVSSLVWAALRERALARRAGRRTKGSLLERADGVAREARHAVRRLLRAPGFTLAAVLTLGLAIGATSALFAVVDAVVLRPLPYPESERLVYLDNGAHGLGVHNGLQMTEGLYVHYRRGSRTIEELAIHQQAERNVTGAGEPVRVEAAYVTPSLGSVLRLQPMLGRWFVEEEGTDRWGEVAVVSETFWRAHLGGDATAIGRTIRLNGRAHEVVGVMPASFGYPAPEVEVWAPLGIFPARARVAGFNYRGVARLRDGVTIEQLRRELNDLIAQVPAAFPDQPFAGEVVESARVYAAPVELKEWMVGGVRRTMWVLLGTVTVVLLIACANVANLFLVRAEGRRHELAVRRALGAGRGAVAASQLSEALMLAAAGGALGAALAAAGVRLLVAHGPATLPRLHEVSFGWGVLGFTSACALLAALAFGAVPLAAAETLREAGLRSTAAKARLRARNALVVAQVAMAFVLLVGGGLMVRSFLHLSRLDPGFDAENVLTFRVVLPGSDYPDRERAAAFHGAMLERLTALPGVVTASGASCLPLDGWCYGDPLMIEGRAVPEGTIPPVVNFWRVLPGFFDALRTRVVSGRGITAEDHTTPTDAVVINEELARTQFAGVDPLGKRLYFMEPDAADVPWFTVVGVVRDLPVESLAEEEPSPTIYLPMLMRNDRGPSVHQMTYVVRTSVPPASLAPAVRAVLRELDDDIPIAGVATMEERVARSSARTSFTMVLLVIAAAAALLLGTIGIYGVISYLVSRRTGEIGIRLALGATPGSVAAMVVRHGAALAVVGLAAGIGGALALGRVIEALLFGVEPTDPLTFAAVTLVLGAVALAACWLPARRAAALSPLSALRAD